MAKVEIYKVLRFCGVLAYSILWFLFEFSARLPCVTKLPKFLPTTQCHVAPALESNCSLSQLWFFSPWGLVRIPLS